MRAKSIFLVLTVAILCSGCGLTSPLLNQPRIGVYDVDSEEVICTFEDLPGGEASYQLADWILNSHVTNEDLKNDPNYSDSDYQEIVTIPGRIIGSRKIFVTENDTTETLQQIQCDANVYKTVEGASLELERWRVISNQKLHLYTKEITIGTGAIFSYNQITASGTDYYRVMAVVQFNNVVMIVNGSQTTDLETVMKNLISIMENVEKRINKLPINPVQPEDNSSNEALKTQATALAAEDSLLLAMAPTPEKNEIFIGHWLARESYSYLITISQIGTDFYYQRVFSDGSGSKLPLLRKNIDGEDHFVIDNTGHEFFDEYMMISPSLDLEFWDNEGMLYKIEVVK